MTKRALPAILVLLLAGGGYAAAAGITISLTPNGPSPALATVAWGDTVTFANGDSKPYQVTIPRSAVESPQIPPGGTFEYVFDGRVGNYQYRQMSVGPSKSGTIVVEAKGSVTLTATPLVVPWGRTLRLVGRSPYPGTPVVLAAYRSPGSAWTAVATQTAGADGSFSFVLKPERGARYRVQVAADQVRSSPVLISVRPRVDARASARRTKAGRAVTITARVTPRGSALMFDLERYDPQRRRWLPELRKRVPSSGRTAFRWEARKGTTRLRVEVARRSVADGYAEATSNTVVVVGR